MNVINESPSPMPDVAEEPSPSERAFRADLNQKLRAPAVSRRSIWLGVASALNTTTGTFAVAGSRCNWRSTSEPCMSGKLRSSRTSFG